MIPSPGESAVRAWTFLTLGDGDRQHGGNAGYDDEPDRYYGWDSTVPNHRGPAVGAICALRDSMGVLGISRIERIDLTEDAKKVRRRCPSCRSTAFKERTGQLPRFRCSACRVEFGTPDEELIGVTAYRAVYASAWIALDGAVTTSELESAYLAHAQQHAIREIDIEQLDRALARKSVYLERSELTADPSGSRLVPGGRRRSTAWQRVGQDPFRRRLLERFGAACAISGPQPAESLHAAHLYDFAENPRHDISGGLLLRADLHGLFDAGLIEVDADLIVSVTPTLRQYPNLWQYNGQPLTIDQCDPLLSDTRGHLAARARQCHQQISSGDSGCTRGTRA